MSLESWVGRSSEKNDLISMSQANAMHSTLGLKSQLFEAGDKLPDFWHWIYFLDAWPRSELGRDGHLVKGATCGLTPPVELPRRMWAGGKLDFLKPIEIGKPAVKTTTIENITPKQGKSGPLCFTTLRHEITQDGDICVIEHQDIVYREDPDPKKQKPTPQVASKKAEFFAEWTADATMLFRYSALTFNGHRIHYDRDYAINTEGYDGLVVHGPLLATMMLDLVKHYKPKQVTHFTFRAISPVMDTENFTCCAAQDKNKLDLWVEASDGRLAMIATANLS